jgi:hypothetical protein
MEGTSIEVSDLYVFESKAFTQSVRFSRDRLEGNIVAKQDTESPEYLWLRTRLQKIQFNGRLMQDEVAALTPKAYLERASPPLRVLLQQHFAPLFESTLESAIFSYRLENNELVKKYGELPGLSYSEIEQRISQTPFLIQRKSLAIQYRIEILKNNLASFTELQNQPLVLQEVALLNQIDGVPTTGFLAREINQATWDLGRIRRYMHDEDSPLSPPEQDKSLLDRFQSSPAHKTLETQATQLLNYRVSAVRSLLQAVEEDSVLVTIGEKESQELIDAPFLRLYYKTPFKTGTGNHTRKRL